MFVFLRFLAFSDFCFSGAIGFAMRKKTGAWAPAAAAGEEVEQEATDAAFCRRLREQLWGQGGKGIFFVKKIYFSLYFLENL